MRTLYPAIEPFGFHRIRVSELHELYVEEVGNPEGLPVLFLHGGPGSGCAPWHRQFFDPAIYRAILVDQRGAGRSTPAGELRDNTTDHLVDDLETIRQQLGIDRWLVFGGSWGSTLALAYAQAHPESVSGLILRGVFTATPEEDHWLMGGMAGWIQPEAWTAFRDFIPAEEQTQLTQAYYRRLTSDEASVRRAAVEAWNRWEGSIVSLLPDPTALQNFRDGAEAPARIECHYFVNGCFLKRPTQLIDDLDRIRHLPCIIVQGRYDVICPVHAAWRLHRRWPESDMRIVPDGSHSAADPAMATALTEAANDMAKRLQGGELAPPA